MPENKAKKTSALQALLAFDNATQTALPQVLGKPLHVYFV